MDRTVKLFRKHSGGDDQMDAGEFAASLRDVLGKDNENIFSTPSNDESGRNLLALLGYRRDQLLSIEDFRNIVDTLTVWKQQYESLRGLTRGVRCHQIRSVFPALHGALTDDVMAVIQQRYTLSQNGPDSLLSVHSFVQCCCRIVCMLGEFERLTKLGAVVRNDRALAEWLLSTLPY